MSKRVSLSFHVDYNWTFFNLFAFRFIVSTSICPTFANLTPTLVSPFILPRQKEPTWLIDFESKFNTLMNFAATKRDLDRKINLVFMLEL
jgi:hypothetical protein